jgi:predicted dehydrogenase
MTTRCLKLGIVGAGFFGQVAHLANFAQLNSCRIVALASLRSDLREQVARKYSIPETYVTHRELLAEADVDAVVVVTNRAATGPVVLDCLQAGKHVLSEKPAAGSVELAERLVAAAERAGVTYSIGYMKRYDAGVQTARQQLESLRQAGTWGPLVYARAHCFGGDAYCEMQDYVSTREPRSGGLERWPMAPAWLPPEKHPEFETYLNTYCHNVNLLRFLVPQENPPSLVDAHRLGFTCVATLEFQRTLATLETGQMKHAGWDEVTEFYFERGALRLSTPAPLQREQPAKVERYDGARGEWSQIPVAPSWAFQRQAAAFIDDVQLGRPSLASAQDSVEDLRIIESIWKRLSK